MTQQDIIVRMPPSPTGSLHLGTARTALFNYLFARKHGGKILFRWEDTDHERSKPEFETEILDGLAWLGMDFRTVAHATYRQSENTNAHTASLQKLWEADAIFPCFVTPAEIEDMRKQAAAEKKNFVFWSPSRDTAHAELQARMDAGESFVWRLRVPQDRVIGFEDLIRGNIEVHTATLGDFVVARSDGSVLYLLANVYDDATQGVTHVLRGEDGISNTPKQILLWEALGFEPPAYGHIPLVLDSQKRKLSKRNVEPGTCVLIRDFQEAGFLPEAVVNGLAFLGWNPKTTEEIFSLADLEKAFDLSQVNPGAAQYDFEKMRWFNAQWLRKIPLKDVLTRYNTWAGISLDGDSALKAIAIVRDKAKVFAEFADELAYLVSDPGLDPKLLLNAKFGVDYPTAARMIAEAHAMLAPLSNDACTQENLFALAKETIARLDVKNGVFLSPFRIALSGRQHSASPFEIIEVLGKEESLRRLTRAQKAAESQA